MGFVVFGDCDQDALLREAQAQPGGPAMSELLRRYEPLVQRIARTLTTCPHTRQDLASEARIAFMKAVDRHRLGRHGFAAYAERYMVGAARRWLSAWTFRSADPLHPNHEPAGQEPVRLTWGEGKIASAVAGLSNAHRELISRRYLLDTGVAELARTARTSESAISQRLRTAERAVARALAA